MIVALALAHAVPAWVPGAAVPGWDDVDCTPTGRVANRIQQVWPTTWSIRGTISDDHGVAQVTALHVDLRDCAAFACTPGQPLDRRDPFVTFDLTALADDGLSRGLGTWGWDADPVRPVSASALMVLGPVVSAYGHTGPVNMQAKACLSRVRPDEIAGVLWMELATQGDPILIFSYPYLDFWMPFDVMPPAHGGVEFDTGPRPPGSVVALPAELESARWEYVGVSYEDAWPWDEIVDEEARTALHDGYTPLISVP